MSTKTVEEKYLEDMIYHYVRVYLRSGYQVKGKLEQFDRNVIIVSVTEEHSAVVKMIYKQNISTIELLQE